jgi:RNA exonuclease 4
MVKPFFSKKQKALMRERRKKIKVSDSTETMTTTNTEEEESKKRPLEVDDTTPTIDDEEGPSKKRQRDESHLVLATKTVNQKMIVTCPPNLEAKEAKKFRKDARRQLRQEGKEDATIAFITTEEAAVAASKKKKKSFPSIKELLVERDQLVKTTKEEEKIQKKMDSVPDVVKKQYVALDCEMVGIGTDGKKSALARVSMVDWEYNVILDTFVQVPTRVTDFRTHVSGVEAKHIQKSKAMDVIKCRKLVASLLREKVLVGHALTNDLQALLLQHPKSKLRDTAKYRPFQRFANNKWRPRKLRDLVKENLKGKEDFQVAEHDSVQDAKATMELFQIVQSAWEKELASKTK